MALVHELGHVLIHATSPCPPGTTAGCRGIQKVEADSVAFVLAVRLGLDTSAFSWPYVASWAGSDPRARPGAAIQAAGVSHHDGLDRCPGPGARVAARP